MPAAASMARNAADCARELADFLDAYADKLDAPDHAQLVNELREVIRGKLQTLRDVVRSTNRAAD
jgi:hypothetical protein